MTRQKYQNRIEKDKKTPSIISPNQTATAFVPKILANQLVPRLDAKISPNQTAFVPTRSIAENILLAQEVIKGYHKNEGQARCTIKVDLMKVYDSINWEFVLHSLGCFGIPEKFIGWVRECITSPIFSVALNGILVGYFEGNKGLRRLHTFLLLQRKFSGEQEWLQISPQMLKDKTHSFVLHK